MSDKETNSVRIILISGAVVSIDGVSSIQVQEAIGFILFHTEKGVRMFNLNQIQDLAIEGEVVVKTRVAQ